MPSYAQYLSGQVPQYQPPTSLLSGPPRLPQYGGQGFQAGQPNQLFGGGAPRPMSYIAPGFRRQRRFLPYAALPGGGYGKVMPSYQPAAGGQFMGLDAMPKYNAPGREFGDVWPQRPQMVPQYMPRF